jgi:hypothetical protein
MKRFRSNRFRDYRSSTKLEGNESGDMPDIGYISDAPGQVKVKRPVVSAC